MKRLAVIPAVLITAFLPVFALQAEKLSAPLPPPKVLSTANAEFVLSEPKLRTTLVTVRYPEVSDKKYVLSGRCATVSEAVWSSVSPTGIRSEIVPVSVSADCAASSVDLAFSFSGKTVPGSGISVPVVSRDSLFVTLSDLSDEELFLFARDSAESSKAASESSRAALSASGATAKDKFSALSLSYRAATLAFRSKEAYALADARKNLKYLVPVANKPMPTDYPFIPGAGRPYRNGVTDGIHHGWDLMVKVGTPVRAVGEGVVVRVVSGFAWRDFDRIAKGDIGPDQKALNLDVYRGNQVWLKTADGNVTFYSHLSAIAPDVAEGKRVAAGEILGNVGVSGVPDRNYKNPHLHFEIQKNPHDGTDSKDPLSVMRWNWLGKDMGKAVVGEMAEEAFAN